MRFWIRDVPFTVTMFSPIKKVAVRNATSLVLALGKRDWKY